MVLCVGQLTVDILTYPIDHFDYDTDTQRIDKIELRSGGDSLNVAIGLKRLGSSVDFVGRIGDDSFGDFLIDIMEGEGIDHRNLIRSSEAATTSVLVCINSRGERVFFYQGGATDLFTVRDIHQELIAAADFVHVGGTYLLPQFDGQGAAQLFAAAHSSDTLTSMDVTWDTRNLWLPTIAPCLPDLDFFLPSIREARMIAGRERPQEIALFLQDLGVQTVIIKLGQQGCFVKPPALPGFMVDAFPVEVVDTTGAGDAFVAGFLTAVLRDWDLEKCALFACAVAALNIRHFGATAGIPIFDTAFEYMERR